MAKASMSIKKIAPFNLEKSLSPAWKSTYYMGFLFDWCRRIPNQNKASITARCLIIFTSFISLIYTVCFSVLQMYRTISKAENKLYDIVQVSLSISDQPLILFVWTYFLVYKTDIQAFFNDWKHMEEHQHLNKYYDSVRIKRTCIIVYTLYYIYGISLICHSSIMCAFESFDGESDFDLLTTFYPSLSLKIPYIICAKMQQIFNGAFLITIFFPLIDIVPTMVYYHAANVLEAMKSEVRELTKDPASPSSKVNTIYSLWSGFETLTEMVRRADHLFGSVVVINQGILFSNICGVVYVLLRMLKMQSVDQPNQQVLISLLGFLFLYPARLLFTISFMSQLKVSSCELFSALSFYSNRREYNWDKEERKIVHSFLRRLYQTDLAACPSGFYVVKTSIFLTMLSLVVTYSIILLQTADDSTAQCPVLTVQQQINITNSSTSN